MEIRETIFNNLDFNKYYPEYDPEQIQEILIVGRTSWVLMMLVLLHFQAL